MTIDNAVVIDEKRSRMGRRELWKLLRMRFAAGLLLSGLLMGCSAGGAGKSNSTDEQRLPGAPAQRANPP